MRTGAPLAHVIWHRAYRAAHRVRLIWWRVAKPAVRGAKTVVLTADRHVLLVRHSYQQPDQYMLPGGGVGRHEDAALAAAREVFEETGVRVTALRLHSQFFDSRQGARNEISIYTGEAERIEPVVDGREIVEASWHPLDALPANISGASRARIIEVRDGLPPATSWRTEASAERG